MEKLSSQQEYQRRIGKILISEEQIQAEIKKAGKKISALYDGRPILLVSILKGSFVFMADLCRAINVPCEVAFMCAKSYFSGTESTGTVNIVMDLDRDVSKYHVVIAEDIVDTGRTLKHIYQMLRKRNPISLTVVTLLDKKERRVVEFTPDISLFDIPDYFVIGYGLDCDEKYRNLPYIAEYNQNI